jgi:hypothetical protein
VSAGQLGCLARTELSDDDVIRLTSVPFAALDPDRHRECELEFGHDGPHVCLGQSSMEGGKATTWWIWWTDAGKHDIRPAETCPVLGDDQHPDLPGCVLPLRHTGWHMFRAGPA